MSRWEINRAGVINFWYYDDDEFEFEEGRLLLRGANGSGKSVTMQSLVPLLFDGNKSPERLDPFGSRARKMDTYLLSDGLDLEERTGYLFLEFNKPSTNRYKTIGIGMRARKNMTMNTWYFVVEDNRRVGKKYDISLYKDIGDKLPLTQKELENRIGSGGHVYTKQRDYKAAVNEHLFGYDDISDFEELIELLIQIRSPKLSKEFKPTTMYEIMQNSLFTLTEEDLRPMSEAIESMDMVKEKIDGLRNSKKSIDRIYSTFNKYNEYLLAYKAKSFLTAQSDANKSKRLLKSLESELTNQEAALRELEMTISRLEEEAEILRVKDNQLRENDLSKLVEDKLEVENSMKRLKEDLTKKEVILENLITEEIDLLKEVKDYDRQHESLAHELENYLEQMKEAAEQAGYDEHDFMAADYEKDRSTVKFEYHKNDLKSYKKKVKIGLDAIKAFEKASEKYNILLKEKDDKQKKYESQTRKATEYERQLGEIKEEFSEKVVHWHSENKVFMFEKNIVTKVIERALQYGEVYNFEQVKAPIVEAYQAFLNSNNQEISVLKGQRALLLDEIKGYENKIDALINQSDMEPERTEDVVRNRARLKEDGIEYIPLYQSLDYQNNLEDSLKNHLEESLMNLGLLDALIIDPKYKEIVLNYPKGYGDKYIFANPNLLSHNLSLYLKPEKSTAFDKSTIDDVIQSIFLDASSDLYVLENGIFGHGVLIGKTSGEYESKYISMMSRKRFRQQQIDEAKEEILKLRVKIMSIEDVIKDWAECLEKGEKEYLKFPINTDLDIAYGDFIENKRILTTLKVEFDQIQVIIEEEYKNLSDAKLHRHDKTHDLYYKLSAEVYEDVLNQLDEYKDLFYEFVSSDHKLSNIIMMLESINFRLDKCKENQDDTRYDLNGMHFDLNKQREKLSIINEQLKVSDYDSFMKELEMIRNRMAAIPQETKICYAKTSEVRTEINKTNERIHFNEKELSIHEKREKLFQYAFEAEYNLGYTNHSLGSEDLNTTCKQILSVLGSILDEGKNIFELREAVYKKFHEEQGELVEYNMKMNSLFKELPFDDVDESDMMHIERIDITSKMQGKFVKFSELVKLLDQQIELNQNLLDEQDRELFEEILINSISRKISSKIYHSEKWVKEIDALMESMDTSSGLKLNLKWLTKNATSEDQMSTRELVKILKSDQGTLTQSQRERLIQHFRSKIKESKAQFGTEDKRSFLAIMKDVLDYRKWFEFQLFFTKTGEKKKELTNNAFFTFSGGEKAMAMYVPLFSAVYAKYQSGANDCPRVISLDEAFAGVDGENIKDMFKLLVELKLSFIANSQVLFGDYDTVPSLGIYELIRPKNVTFVTLIRYKWNGLIRTLVNDE